MWGLKLKYVYFNVFLFFFMIYVELWIIFGDLKGFGLVVLIYLNIFRFYLSFWVYFGFICFKWIFVNYYLIC